MSNQSYTDHIHAHDRLLLQRAVHRQWRLLGVTIRDAVRTGDTAALETELSRDPTARWTYDSWKRCTEQLGSSVATVQTQRVRLCRVRSEALKQIAPFDRDLTDDQLRAKYPIVTETLRDVEWRLGLLRKGIPGMQPWQETADRRKLRKWKRRLEMRLTDARIAGTPTIGIESELQGVTDKERMLALEEYDQKLREWLDAIGGQRKRAPRTPAERRGARGGRRGRRPGDTCENTAPHRPQWLIDLDVQAARDELMDAQLQPVRDERAERLERAQIVSDRKASLQQEKRRATLESHVVTLLDWAWGEGRRMHIGEEIDTEQGTWLYIDDAHGVPRASTPSRAAALASCAVRLSTGWAFPPETARGRQ
jgi:hypothetical protein